MYKRYLFFLLFLIALFISINGIFSFNFFKQRHYFNENNVALHIKNISKKPHSIFDSLARCEVRDYLANQIIELGVKPRIFAYDSIPCKFGGFFSIADIYAEFKPTQEKEDSQYLLLIAHLDSRFFQKVKKDTVNSFGAADDGYGLGVILEIVKGALKYRKDWKQGIKILFTDAEEHELDGMREFIKNEKCLLDNVNFVINIEARGVDGPVFLFETNNKNDKLISLYKKANYPYTYSLTTFVYSILPNDTDFSLVKDSIPGFNFAVLDNLNFYHTDKDNYSNISLNSLSHYGEQIEPIVTEYLTNNKFSSSNSLKGKAGIIFFTIPLLGLFTFSFKQFVILNLITLLFFLFYLSLFLKRSRIQWIRIFKYSFKILIWLIIVIIFGELIAWLLSVIYKVDFNIISTKYIDSADIIIVLLLCANYLLFYNRLTELTSNWKNLNNFICGTIILFFIISTLLLIFIRENFFIIIPIIIGVITLFISFFKLSKFFYLLNTIILTLLGGSFIYTLYIALTIGSLGVILAISTLFIILIIFNYLCYTKKP